MYWEVAGVSAVSVLASRSGSACRMASIAAAVWQLAALSLVRLHRGWSKVARRHASWYARACWADHRSLGVSAFVRHRQMVWRVAITWSFHIGADVSLRRRWKSRYLWELPELVGHGVEPEPKDFIQKNVVGRPPCHRVQRAGYGPTQHKEMTK
jgi:hypothetical protein